MKRFMLFVLCAVVLWGCNMTGANFGGKGDKYTTMLGDLYIKPLGHSSLWIKFKDKNIYVDPFSQVADFSKLPKADLILITHGHQDHLDKAAIDALKKADTKIIASKNSAKDLPDAKIMPNGYGGLFEGIEISATPAYNIVRKRGDGKLFHERGEGNGYLLNFGDFKLYIGGDTENIAELELLRGVDVAFLPKDDIYTMNDDMFIDAVKKMQPKIVYPYHGQDADIKKIQQGVGKDIEVK